MRPTARKFIEIFVLTLALGFIIRTLANDWHTMPLTPPRWSLLVIALGVFYVYFLSRALAWWLILRALGAPVTLIDAGSMWFVAELNRYIPGNVWSLLSRVYLGEKKGVPPKITSVGIIIEIIAL